jgi:hypothetical protein
MMKTKLVLGAVLLAIGLSQTASASDQFAGVVLGGATGAIVGHAIGGHDGAVVGGVLGAVVGAAATDDRYEEVRYIRRGPVVYGPPAILVPAGPPHFRHEAWREGHWEQHHWGPHQGMPFHGDNNPWGHRGR